MTTAGRSRTGNDTCSPAMCGQALGSESPRRDAVYAGSSIKGSNHPEIEIQSIQQRWSFTEAKLVSTLNSQSTCGYLLDVDQRSYGGVSEPQTSTELPFLLPECAREVRF